MAKPNLAGSVPAADQAARPVSSARWALAGLALSVLLSSLGTSIANVGLPALTEAFGASFQAVQWVVLAYLLATTALVVAHRPSTVMLADRVALLEEGRISAVGTHSELLRTSEFYRHVISSLEAESTGAELLEAEPSEVDS